jgi:hypothetical protein
MLRSIKALHSYAIEATDGNLGSVYDFYFDDLLWTIRYVVVDTGTWLPGRRVLISPTAIEQPHEETKQLAVNLTQEQVENSPDMDSEQPVSRHHQIALHEHYAWPAYWAVAPDGLGTLALPPDLVEEFSSESGDPHLQSTQEVLDYYIHASDGDIGHVEDFIVDDASWSIRYMVVNTRNWLPGKKVLVAPQWITEVIWGEAKVYVNLTREAIQESPEYDPDEMVHRAYEERLYDFYDRPKYWS